MPTGWRALSGAIKERDKGRCRFCGRLSEKGAVDHLVPRKLLRGRETAIKANLAWLCPEHHAFKTMNIEPSLYGADIGGFESFLKVLVTSGPIPSPFLRARAYKRLQEVLYADPHNFF
jgi:hypothetical protein